MFRITYPRLIALIGILGLIVAGGYVPLAHICSTSVPTAQAGAPDLPLDDFFEQSFEQILLRSPEWITDLGIADRFGMRNDQLDDLSDDYLNGTYDLKTEILDQLHTYDRAALTPEQQVSYDVYAWWLEKELAGRAFMYHDYPVHHFVNNYQGGLFSLFTGTHPLATAEDAEDYVSRLQQTGVQVRQVLDGLKIREEMGIIPPKFIVQYTQQSLLNDLGLRTYRPQSIKPKQIVLYASFAERLPDVAGLSETDQQTLLAAALAAVEESFIPAYQELVEFMFALEEKATDDAGLWRLPDGEAYYEYALYDMTSTAMTPQEIHDLGLSEVTRVQAELYAVFAQLGYDTEQSFGRLLNQAVQEGGFVSGRAATLDAYEALIADMDTRLDDWFDVRPQAGLIVVEEPAGGGGYYMAGSIDGSRPGAFHAGIGGQTALFSMPSLTYHEGIPGHHFQIALALESDLPLFRNALTFNGYIEGWALYAEQLAWEMGVYDDDPYGNVGRLYYELLRAVRLVTDTGIHNLGWTRDEARAYMRETLGGDGWTHEVERYIVLPAQATGYKVGMIAMLDLRQRAKDALGDQFDIREFHNVVLTNGSVPLEILEQIIDDWIASKQG